MGTPGRRLWGRRRGSAAIAEQIATPVIPAYPDETDAGKRLLDLAVAGLALLLLGPLMVAIGILVRLTSRGPAIFAQERIGQGGRPFVLHKFRTMYARAGDEAHRAYVQRLLTDEQPPDGGRPGVYKLADDPRVTPLGRWLRRTSLDELPQLVDVLAGHMSIVGPRPVLGWEVELFEPRHLERFRVRPGMTGLWQVSGRSHLGMREALDLDVAYARRHSHRLDLAILARTVPVVLRGGGAG